MLFIPVLLPAFHGDTPASTCTGIALTSCLTWALSSSLHTWDVGTVIDVLSLPMSQKKNVILFVLVIT